MGKNNKGIYGKGISLIAVAAISAVLISTPLYNVSAEYVNENVESEEEKDSILPDNITIETVKPLHEIELPENEYGELFWEDDSLVPEERVSSFNVILEPFTEEDRDYLSELEGWDEESGKYYGSITIVVSEMESFSEEYYEENNEETIEEIISEETVEASEETAEIPEETKETKETAEIPEETEETETEGTEPEEAATEEVVEAPEVTEPEDAVTDEVEEVPEEVVETPEESEEIVEIPKESEEVEKAPEGESEETVEIPEEETEEIPEENIFDNNIDVTEDGRLEEIEPEEDTYSEEEKEQIALQNHTCSGITVSGIDLPWYVQFRVSGGEEYTFTNEVDAEIFKSYEFELWNLLDDTEYQIPDGEYVSVTVPVKEGYEYSVEHILDNGALETIIPTVDGNIMIFSTHSFSPFGIAGSKPLVGEDIAQNEYPDKTPTPTPTVSPSVTPGTGINNSGNNNSTNSNSNNSSSSNNSSNSFSENNNSQVVPDDHVTGESVDNSANNETSNRDQNNNVVMNNVNTGDTTQILPYILLIVTAVLAGVVVMILKKRK